MMRSNGLVASAVVCIGACVAIAMSACGSSSDESGFGGGASGTNGPNGDNGGGTLGGGTSGASGASGGPAKVDECKKMDIVFVVDNSGSMKEEQDNLAVNFPKFAKVISDYKTKSGDSLDFRIAVTSSDDKKEKGKFLNVKGAGVTGNCTPGPTRPWLERGELAQLHGVNRYRMVIDSSKTNKWTYRSPKRTMAPSRT